MSSPQGRSASLRGPLIFDASAVFNFGHRGDLGSLLLQLRERFALIVPMRVAEEVIVDKTFAYEDFLSLHFQVEPFVAPKSLAIEDLALLSTRLGQGEIEVLLLAEHLQGTAVIDERAARRVAGRRGIAITGTLGLLAYAVEQALMTDTIALETVERLRRNRFRCPAVGESKTFAAYLAHFAAADDQDNRVATER